VLFVMRPSEVGVAIPETEVAEAVSAVRIGSEGRSGALAESQRYLLVEFVEHSTKCTRIKHI
jgi:hypothetical protein